MARKFTTRIRIRLPVAVLTQTTTGTGTSQTTATNVYYVYADHINTPRVITQATDNQMVWRWDNADPFGLLPPTDNPSGLGMLRVWIAEPKLHCSIKVCMYQESMNIPEEKAWGTILADAARHWANALESCYSTDASESLKKIRDVFIKELEDATSDAEGDFVKKH